MSEQNFSNPANYGNPPFPPPPHYNMPKNRSNWWVILLVVAAIFIMFFLLIVGVIGYITSEFKFEKKETKVHENSILHLKIDSGLKEYSSNNEFAELFGGTSTDVSLLDILTAIEKAKDDDKIKGIFLEPGIGLSWVKSLEVQDAILDFKKSGKFVYSYMEAANEATYLIAAVADSVFMPNEGFLEMNGFGVTGLFLKDAMKELGIEFETIAFEDFKSAGDMFSRSSYSDSSKMQLRVLINNTHNTFVNRLSEYRNINTNEINDLLNKGEYLVSNLQKLGYIDVFASREEVKDIISQRVGRNIDEDDEDESKPNKSEKSTKVSSPIKDIAQGFKDGMTQEDGEHEHDIDIKIDSEDENIDIPSKSKVKYISPRRYLDASSTKSKKKDSGKTIALVYGSGAINSGKGNESPFGDDEQGIYSDSFVAQLKKARENDDVEAIIIRIDSPGGSAMASDIIWKEIRKTSEIKPVIASMSDVAASGGYYMAMACDTIVAHPNTITGSIGVIMSIPNLSGLTNKLKIKVDTISTSQAAQFMNGAYPYTQSDLLKLRGMAEQIYTNFVTKAAQSRGKSYDELRSLAKGRVWTGTDAKEKGLVDELGGIKRSIEIAKQRIGLESEDGVKLAIYPKKGDSFEQFINKLFKIDDEEESSFSLKSNNVQLPENLLFVYQQMPKFMQLHFKYAFNLWSTSRKENAMLSLPNLISIE